MIVVAAARVICYHRVYDCAALRIPDCQSHVRDFGQYLSTWKEKLSQVEKKNTVSRVSLIQVDEGESL